MSILLDESVVALNEVTRAGAVSVDTLDWAAEHCTAEAQRRGAAEAAAVRRNAAAALVEAMLANELEAKLPDPEATGFDALVSAAKAVVGTIGDSSDEGGILAAVAEAEVALREALDRALRFEHPAAVSKALTDANSEVARTRAALSLP